MWSFEGTKEGQLGQLNNSLHYDKVDSDPTLDHFEQVENWGRKWLSEGDFF